MVPTLLSQTSAELPSNYLPSNSGSQRMSFETLQIQSSTDVSTDASALKSSNINHTTTEEVPAELETDSTFIEPTASAKAQSVPSSEDLSNEYVEVVELTDEDMFKKPHPPADPMISRMARKFLRPKSPLECLDMRPSVPSVSRQSSANHEKSSRSQRKHSRRRNPPLMPMMKSAHNKDVKSFNRQSNLFKKPYPPTARSKSCSLSAKSSAPKLLESESQIFKVPLPPRKQ